MPISLKNKRIILSKTNQIGDVLFALPIASALKAKDPSCTIIFLGRKYTRDLIAHYNDVDEFADWEEHISTLPEKEAIQAFKDLKADIILHIFPRKEIVRLAKLATIPYRIATYGRLYNWLYCNRLVRIHRKKSPLHETQLDMQMMTPFGIKKNFSLDEIIALQHFVPFENHFPAVDLLKPGKFNLILHPLTRGRHIEWPLEKFAALIRALPRDKFRIFVTGVEKEGVEIRPIMIDPFLNSEDKPDLIDLTGKLSLDELMQFISKADGLICASTGPVHLAAAFGIYTLGLYAPIKPFHAGRWGPVGKKAQFLSLDKNCEACRYENTCACIGLIDVVQVKNVVTGWLNGLELTIKSSGQTMGKSF